MLVLCCYHLWYGQYTRPPLPWKLPSLRRGGAGGEVGYLTAAMTSISTDMSPGRRAAWIVVRAGGFCAKKVA